MAQKHGPSLRNYREDLMVHTLIFLRAQKLSWKRHPSISDIYGKLLRFFALLQEECNLQPGHCYRAKNEVISSLLLWKSSSDHARGRKLSFHDVFSRDSSIRTEDLGTVMLDRDVWRGVVNSMKATTVD